MASFGNGKTIIPILVVKPKNSDYGHTIFIKDLDMFLKVTKRRANGKVYEQKHFWCLKCIQQFASQR